jgi:hypothetical protein
MHACTTDRVTGERIYVNCGCVVDNVAAKSKDLPFGETYALTSNIAFGKSLGCMHAKLVDVVLAYCFSSFRLRKLPCPSFLERNTITYVEASHRPKSFHVG